MAERRIAGVVERVGGREGIKGNRQERITGNRPCLIQPTFDLRLSGIGHDRASTPHRAVKARLKQKTRTR